MPIHSASARGTPLQKTGDRARFLPDGNLEFLGLLDHQVNRGGNPHRVGRDRNGAAPASSGARVRRHHARRQSHREKRLVAYLVSPPPPRVCPLTCARFSKNACPSTWFPPPWSCRRPFRSPQWQTGSAGLTGLTPRAPSRNSPGAGTDPHRAGTSPIWQEVLKGNSPGRPGQFLRCGRPFFTGYPVIARIHDALQIQVPLPILFQKPTIRDMAQAIDLLRTQGVAAIEQLYPSFDLAAEVHLDPLITRHAGLPHSRVPWRGASCSPDPQASWARSCLRGCCARPTLWSSVWCEHPILSEHASAWRTTWHTMASGSRSGESASSRCWGIWLSHGWASHKPPSLSWRAGAGDLSQRCPGGLPASL